MVLVSGRYCPFVAHRCEKQLGVFVGGAPQDGPSRCARYADSLLCEGRPSLLHFCIDRFEYPNVEGVRPAVLVDFGQAEQACAVEGKTLCDAAEWAFACEGSRTWPYPHGLDRRSGACNIDRPQARPDAVGSRPADAAAADVAAMLGHVDGRVPSGTRPRCTSPFGVADTTGNVAEWVHDPQADAALVALMGGHFGLGEATCRSRTRPGKRSFRSHRAGFRCCSRVADGQPRRRLLPNGVRLERRRRLR
jgi:hypothetical protein